MGIMLVLLGKGEEKMEGSGVEEGNIHKPYWEMIKENHKRKLESSSSKTVCQHMEQLKLS